MMDSKLRREEMRALEVLKHHLRTWKDNVVHPCSLTVDVICETGKMLFVRECLKTSSLPRGEAWIWNQSRSRKVINLDDEGIQVCFYKVNSRLAKGLIARTRPYKLWVYNMTIQNEEVSFLWCEKGDQTRYAAAAPTDDMMDFQMEILPVTLQDLSFLKPFVTNYTATAFGW